ncbi:CG0192-related protein [Humibacter sp.]|uniref:CG0192-related protein n=1 Tax=Humibacter sp. TaxID=1940291 RepID=UPI003F821119
MSAKREQPTPFDVLCQGGRMALIHHAELVPSKLELLAAWLPSQSFWPDGATKELERVAAYRFDDPAGKVGIETLIVRVPTPTRAVTLQVPLTYREAPLSGGEAAFIGNTEHSVLGTRWVYDATGDPVYLAELVRTIVTGHREVEQFYEENGERTVKPGDAQVRGSGHPDAWVPATPTDPTSLVRESDAASTCVGAGDVRVRLVRDLGAQDAGRPQDGDGLLLGDWAGVTGALLAVVSG